MTNENPVKDLKDGTRVRVTFEGVVDGVGVAVNANVFLYGNTVTFGAAEVEVLKSPVEVGEFFVRDDEFSSGFAGLVLTDNSYVVVHGNRRGGVISYDRNKIHEHGYRVATHEEVQALLAGTDEAKTTINADW